MSFADSKGGDRRAFGRRDSRIAAVVIVPGQGSLACIVKNFSEHGALLQLDQPIRARGHFRLIAETHRVDVICQLRHEGPEGLGVQFVSGSTGTFSEAMQPADLTGLVPPPAREVKRAEPISGRDLRRKLLGAGAG